MNPLPGETAASAHVSSGASKWRSLADRALNAGVPLWFTLAGVLAATMSLCPHHIYI